MAFIDARTLRQGHRIEADICVIGSGAAGLAIAKRFLGSSRNVVVLESGGEQPDEETQGLCQGRSIGQLHAPLHTSRLRYFGGTTNHWTGHVRNLDPIDFERRAWVPDSGWPIDPSDLDLYWEQACAFLGLPEEAFDIATSSAPDRRPWAFEEGRIQSRLRRVVPERNLRLGPMLRDEMAGSTNVDIYLYANVLRIGLAEVHKQVRQLEVSTLTGTRFTAHARAFVLATGGIENPRILLLSEIGIRPDPRRSLVGRYFANHPATDVAEIQLSGLASADFYLAMRAPDVQVASLPFLAISSATQRRFELLNTWLQVTPRLKFPLPRPPRDKKLGELVANLALDMEGLTRREAALGRPGPRLVLRAIAEQAPNPQSRVFLDDTKDRFGQRRAVLDWQLTELDSASAHETVRVVTRELGIAGLGRVRSVFPKGGFSEVDARGSYHHMGTTRMHRDASQGVVDANCRVHGISNLYVAGSSVFPTTGTSNPTLTILALAFRLAAPLKAKT